MAALILEPIPNRAKAGEPIDPLAASNGSTRRASRRLTAIRLSPALVARQGLSNMTVALSSSTSPNCSTAKPGLEEVEPTRVGHRSFSMHAHALGQSVYPTRETESRLRLSPALAGEARSHPLLPVEACPFAL
jgi:hypothetical protein